MTRIRYFLEAAGLYLFLSAFYCLPPRLSSAVGGWIGKTVGPLLSGASRKAMDNLRLALPACSAGKRKLITKGMWSNLGRVIAEYPHLDTIGARYTDFVGGSIAKKVKESGKGAIFFGAHLANWEVFAPALLHHTGLNLDLVYRKPNNPWTARILDRTRTLGGKFRSYAKSKSGTRQMVQAARDGRYIGILIDQKYNEGIPAPFFGKDAMTSMAFIQLAQKFNMPLIPFRTERLDGCRFKITLHPPLDTNRPPESVLKDAHALLEQWITERPEQWLWIHRRWPREKEEKEENQE